jgi:hypothetical protein
MNVIRLETKKFYSTMKEWWGGHEETMVSPSMLPEYTFVCFNDSGKPVYSVCFYNTDSNLCWIGWQLGNPTIKKEDKKGCFKYLHDKVEEFAKAYGYQVLFTTSKTQAVIGTLEKCEYIEGDTNVNHYIKLL